MSNNWVRLTVLLSVLLLMVFPFAGLAPLTLLLFVGICGWVFQLVSTILGANDSSDTERSLDG
ncbi:MAG: hypothetical protein WBD47_08880 [Phormidesmis sp.]